MTSPKRTGYTRLLALWLLGVASLLFFVACGKDGSSGYDDLEAGTSEDAGPDAPGTGPIVSLQNDASFDSATPEDGGAWVLSDGGWVFAGDAGAWTLSDGGWVFTGDGGGWVP